MDLDIDLVDVEKFHQEASDVKCFCLPVLMAYSSASALERAIVACVLLP